MKLLCSFIKSNSLIHLIHFLQIDATQFGKTLLDSIMVEIKSGGPLETLQQTLHEIEDRYIADQKEDDQTNYAFQEQCDQDIAQYDKELAISNDKKIALEAKLEGDLYTRKSVIQGVVNSKSKEVADYKGKLNHLDQVRFEESEEFNQIMKEHDQATTIITEVRRLFQESIQEPSFLQKKKINLDTVSLLQKHLHEGAISFKRFKHKKGYGAIFKLLITITNSKSLASEDNLNRLELILINSWFQQNNKFMQ